MLLNNKFNVYLNNKTIISSKLINLYLFFYIFISFIFIIFIIIFIIIIFNNIYINI